MEKENKQVKLIDPLAIAALVYQACQSFELLERIDNGSVKLSPPFSKTEGINDLESTCQRALVMHFVVLVARLWRLCSKFEDTAWRSYFRVPPSEASAPP
jgi:hypothetical protein